MNSYTVVLISALISFSLASSNAGAATAMPSDYRLTVADDKFPDTWQFAVAYRMRAPGRLYANRMELAVGTISTFRDSNVFASFGPVWRLPVKSGSLFLELSVSPTVFSGSSFNGRDLGGNFHFTSSGTVGTTFGTNDQLSLSLRIQHTSNAGINDTNPGMDMVGLNLTFRFSDP